MKSSLLFAVGFALAWVALTPVTCRAQAEIAPDQFEMINVEPFSHTNAAANAKPAPIRIGDERKGNSSHKCANRKAPGSDKSKDSFLVATNSCGSGVSQPSKRVKAVERFSNRARVELNSPSSGGEAKLPREVLQPKP